MSDARPFITAPCAVWRRDPALNGSREDSITLFKEIALASDREWRIEVSPEAHAFSVRQLCFLCPERFRRWSEDRIDRALAELRARGCLILATANDREWLEIPDRLAYCKGHRKQEPLRPLEQVPLALAETSEASLFALAPPSHWNERREEQSRKEPNLPAREPRPGESVAVAIPKSGNRFAVSVEELNGSALGRRAGAFIGASQWLREAQASGREWLRVLRDEAEELSDILEQAERVRGELPESATRAKFLTKRLGERRSRSA
jgi:hypothetical protein